MTDDKKTIGLTPNNREVLNRIMELDFFQDQMDAAKFAMSLAINSGVEIGSMEGTETIWNIGSFDPEGEIKTLIQVLFPGVDSPYRVAEYYINVGLGMLEEYLQKHNYKVYATDLLDLREMSES